MALTAPAYLRGSPLTALFAKSAAPFIPCVFISLRTLLRNGTLPRPFVSITSALFPMQWGVWGASFVSRFTNPHSLTPGPPLLFSTIYALPNLQAICFHTVATVPGGGMASAKNSPVTTHESPVTNSFICLRSKQSPTNPNHCHISESALPQAFCLPHIRDPGGFGFFSRRGGREAWAAVWRGRDSAWPHQQSAWEQSH